MSSNTMATRPRAQPSAAPIDNHDNDYSGWLMYHSVGMFPGQQSAIAAALQRFAEVWCAPDDQRWDITLGARHALLTNWAQLIGTEVANVFTAANVTDAFARFIDALGARRLRGRTVLVAADCFPSLHFLLNGVAEQYGFTLVTVPLRPGEAFVRDADFIAMWNQDVALALVTWVSSLTSKRADLAALAAHAHSVGSLVAVDITQGAGIVPFDLREPGFEAFDFVCTTTLKWLCGVPGTGLGYIAPALLADGVAPQARGWFSQDDPFNWDIERFEYAPDARRFDTGTPSVLPCFGSAPGFEWLLAQAPGTLRSHNLALSHRIIEILDARGYPLLSPRNDAERGGSVMASVPAHLDIQQVLRTLAAERITIDARGRSIRLSPGSVTTLDGLDRLARCLPV